MPLKYVNDDGSLNTQTAPRLSEYYAENPFRQIIYAKLIDDNKEAVVDAITVVGTFQEIESVAPNWILTQTAYIPNDTYLKVAVGKGLITPDRIGELIGRYSEFF